MNDKARLLCGFRKRRTDWVYLVNRRVSRVELTRQVVKARIATCLSDFLFLRGSHLAKDNISPRSAVSQRQLPWCGALGGRAYRRKQDTRKGRAGSPLHAVLQFTCGRARSDAP